MARNTIHLDAAPEAVWAVFEDPTAYPQWVVGADKTLTTDLAWPAVGTAFKVRLALGVVDATTVREVERGKRLVLDAGSWLFGPARVTLELEPEGDGTLLTMIEDPAGKLAPLRLLPPVHGALRLRNAESLRRLRRLVARRAATAA